MQDKVFTYISLFSCAGVGCFAFKQQGFSCIATNELLGKRLDIQRYNKKCLRDEGYIHGDLCLQEIKDKIYSEVKFWKKNKKIDSVDVIISTPPCQGMSVFNHKKKTSEINRNSLVLESIKVILDLLPKFFIFENVPAFLKTECILDDNSKSTIREALYSKLGNKYSINAEIVNFKNYGSNSSRTRTLVLGVRNDYSKFVSPVELFPNYEAESTLRQTIGHLKSLNRMGQIDEKDLYQGFRAYPEYMLKWIENTKEGESAFNNCNDMARPYKIGKNGEIIQNTNKNGGKYTRLYWDKIAPAVHTRNDQLASQNTIHPTNNRVLSIRELMLVMTIPNTFEWLPISFEEVNELSLKEKMNYLKKYEMLIRQCIREAVPTKVFESVAVKIKNALLCEELSDIQIQKIIIEKKLTDKFNLKQYVDENTVIGLTTLSRIVELANNERNENAAYYTGKETLSKIFESLPEINKEQINILEPSVGAGNFLPFIIARYSYAKQLNIDVVDIDSDVLDILKMLNEKRCFPKNIKINYLNDDFIERSFDGKYDLIIGNPPFKQIRESNSKLKCYKELLNLKESKNLSSFFLEKSVRIATNIILILPKSFLTSSEYREIRNCIGKYAVYKIIDFGEKGFKGVNIETVCIFINTEKKPQQTEIESITRNERIVQNQEYIMPNNLPNWVVYRNTVFDEVLLTKSMNVFDFYRDRYLSKKNTLENGDIWIIQARNIQRDGSLKHIEKYDRYIKNENLKTLACAKYKDMQNVYIVPNMTYYPRMLKKPINTIVNGTVAILIPKEKITISDNDILFICSEKYEEFYRVAMNHSTRTLNVDSSSIYYYCISKNV